ncbi:60S ribosomal protein l19 [Niveomyces insectorum RCEF 264]|uniref:60S ribosomal protein l19 n=1 Tax=Niveomyces insectorum RCEF 264 TaxID=1081102 RepID=A0A167URV4_9HYPO|nr:60S ribosomal protein l19 [Niveomyces insectorum RCEF 264]
MSDSNAAGPAGSNGQWPPRRPSKRSKLRNGTFIIPSTGERSRRQFTLRTNGHAPASGFPLSSGDNMTSPSSSAARGGPHDGAHDGRSGRRNDDNDDPSSYFTAAGFSARIEAAGRAVTDGFARFRAWADSPNGHGVIKCTVAYTLAGLWTFWPPLSDLLGHHRDGKHLVATITVYFHPARSAGSMLEASAIGVVAVVYATVMSVLSMAASVLLGSVLGWVTFAYVVVLVLFIGCDFGFIGWVKQRLNHPSVNVGCTLASLAVITVVTKETHTYSSVFSNAKIVQMLQTLVFAITTTATVSLLLWRVSARALLRTSFARASVALGDMLAMITHGFLSGAEDELTGSAEYTTAAADWAQAYAQMTKNLKEAKYEHYAVGHASLYRLEKAVYKSMETLAQSIGGLRSAANTQFELLRESSAAATAALPNQPSSPLFSPMIPSSAVPVAATASSSSLPSSSSSGPASGASAARPLLYRASSSFQRSGRLAVLSAIDEASDESSEDRPATPLVLHHDDGHGFGYADDARFTASPPSLAPSGPPASHASRRNSNSSTVTLRTSSEIFELFIGMLGPSMKSLAFTLASVLRDAPFGNPSNNGNNGNDDDGDAVHVNAHYRQSLTDALALFNTARADALEALYKTIELGRPRSEKIKADFEEVAAACGHFSFSLQAFGEEMSKYLDVLDDLTLVQDHNRRSWRWLLFWKTPQTRFPSVLPYDVADDLPREYRGSQDGVRDSVGDDAGAAAASTAGDTEPLVRPIRKSQLPRGIPEHMVQRRDTFSWQAAPQANALVRRLAQALLRFVRVLARDDIRFGIKVGIGAVLWAMLAFISQTRGTYMHWRGEWGLLSFMIVCSMTVGASNTTAWARFLATLVGSTCAVINWHISQGHAVPLMLLGGLVASCSFYVMIVRGKPPLGRTTLLAYNVITLYAYSLSQRIVDDDDNDDDQDEGGLHPLIFEIAKHRFVAVTAGILWGLIVCRVVWPVSARRRFKEGLAVLYLQMGLIWRRGPLAILLRSSSSDASARNYLKSGEQAALQRYAARLETLRQGAAAEFELRGPFPAAAAGRILAATTRVLDGFYAMSLLTQRRGTGNTGARLTPGERALLYYTAPERAMLCDRICHVFQVLASSYMLEYPLTDALPGVTVVRDRLLAKVFQFRKEHALSVKAATAAVETGDNAAGKGTEGNIDNENPPQSPRASPSTAAIPPAHVEERDYALLYAYALITGQVAEELKVIEKEFERLFGVLNGEAMLLE